MPKTKKNVEKFNPYNSFRIIIFIRKYCDWFDDGSTGILFQVPNASIIVVIYVWISSTQVLLNIRVTHIFFTSWKYACICFFLELDNTFTLLRKQLFDFFFFFF